jgi:hypothetical protein
MRTQTVIYARCRPGLSALLFSAAGGLLVPGQVWQPTWTGSTPTIWCGAATRCRQTCYGCVMNNRERTPDDLEAFLGEALAPQSIADQLDQKDTNARLYEGASNERVPRERTGGWRSLLSRWFRLPFRATKDHGLPTDTPLVSFATSDKEFDPFKSSNWQQWSDTSDT